VSVVDYDTEEVVLDRLVKPENEILDYLTRYESIRSIKMLITCSLTIVCRWSGITASALLNVTTTLSSVQHELLALLTPPPTTSSTSTPTPTPILLGHSLENDLRALKLIHPRCIDTALLFHHPRGRPLKPGLAWLVKKWCEGREVQNRGEGGHDSEEDARACVELVKRKCKGGVGFGEFRTDMEGLFERMGRGTRRAGVGVNGTGGGDGRWILASGAEEGVVSELRTVCVDRGRNPAGWHGAGAGRCIGCATDEEVVKGVVGAVEESDFVWARLMGVAEASGCE
jgi:RNA exonuclease 1